ncbi:hypothetical protein GE061_005956 [Apolygus lucorum]|uniref:Cytosol aminopeptidase n=1 Tax=Apolygus lucorum TaxID=248454 RepID=A0A6A4J9G7_APOLU|nr:hypothetical protein GE061_005956 [Apolygus lucorum]
MLRGRLPRCFYLQFRFAGDCLGSSTRKGVVLGAYDGCSEGEIKLTPTGLKLDEETGGKLRMVTKDGAGIRKGTAQVFTNLHPEYYSIAIAGLGPEGVGVNEPESLDECKENIRWAAATGARALQESGVHTVFVEAFTNSEAAAEGSVLSVWRYQELKSRSEQQPLTKVDLFEDNDRDGWMRGQLKAESQNLARKIEETPGNLMTPVTVAQIAIDVLCPCGIQVEVRDKDWLETKKFSALLTVAKGSCEDPVLLELAYCGGEQEEKPVVFVGKGITFDSGGLCLGECEGMSKFRGDLAGAAVIIAVFKAAATMALPINLRAYIPLCESMIGGMSMKPGDAVQGLNGKTVVIEDTHLEGRIIMMDPMTYSSIVHPCLMTTVGTMTSGIKWSIGSGPSGVFTNSHPVWREINRAGMESGDRVWRLPLWKYYTRKVTSFTNIDVHNVGKKVGAATCLGAAFLQEFMPPKVDLLHFDISGTGMISTGIGAPYLRKGLMTGRPVRTLIQFLYQIACPHSKGDEC